MVHYKTSLALTGCLPHQSKKTFYRRIMKNVIPFLMFTNCKADDALTLYSSLFEGTKTEKLIRWDEDCAGGPKGTIKSAIFTINGQSFRVMDSEGHAYGFTPAFSFFVTCESEAEIRKAYEGLAEGGKVHMEMGEYPFAKLFAWVEDKFGISWQLAFEG
jgi:predicted 3-demethylubiquinone-9 3-methyltransferase (glyoxalase superfamily)